METNLMSRCIHCWRAPKVEGRKDGTWLISCDGINVAGESYQEAVALWNMEMTKTAAGLVA